MLEVCNSIKMKAALRWVLAILYLFPLKKIQVIVATGPIFRGSHTSNNHTGSPFQQLHIILSHGINFTIKVAGDEARFCWPVFLHSLVESQEICYHIHFVSERPRRCPAWDGQCSFWTLEHLSWNVFPEIPQGANLLWVCRSKQAFAKGNSKISCLQNGNMSTRYLFGETSSPVISITSAARPTRTSLAPFTT